MDTFEYWHLWLIAFALLLIAELLTSGFLLACFSVGALGAAVVDLVGLGIEWQLGVFALFSLIALFRLRPFLRRISTKPNVVSGVDGLIGKRVRLPQAILSDGSYIELSIGGDVWRARGAQGQSIAQGATVQIINRDGLVLLVEEVEA